MNIQTDVNRLLQPTAAAASHRPPVVQQQQQQQPQPQQPSVASKGLPKTRPKSASATTKR